MTRQRLIKAGRLPLRAPFLLLVVALSGVAGCASKVEPASSPPPGEVAVASGQPIQLTSCPAELPKPGAYSPGPASIMVPATPNAARICRYNGLNTSQPEKSLAKSGTVNAAELPALVASLNAAGPMPTGAMHCPMDNGSNDVAIFDYSDGHTVFVTVGLTGCNVISNGTRIAHLTSETTLGQLATVVGSSVGPGQPAATG